MHQPPQFELAVALSLEITHARLAVLAAIDAALAVLIEAELVLFQITTPGHILHVDDPLPFFIERKRSFLTGRQRERLVA